MRRPIENLDPNDPRVVAAKAARAVLGSGQILAERIGMKRQAVYWQMVPAERVLAVEAATGISRHELRPDVFGSSVKRSRICKALGLTLAEIAGWDRVPPECVLKIEQVTGVSRHHMRPDVFGVAADRQRARVPEAPRPRGERHDESMETSTTN